MTSDPRLTLALAWQALDAELALVKKEEAEKRAELVLACFPAGVVEGTNSVEISAGYVVKAIARSSPKVEPTLIKGALAKLAAIGEAGALLADRLIRWKPDLSLSEWKKLTPKQKVIFKQSIGFGLGSPAVTLIEPTA